MLSSNCPSASRLIAFAIGEPVSDVASLCAHIDACAECQAILTRLEALVEPSQLLPWTQVADDSQLLVEPEFEAATNFVRKLTSKPFMPTGGAPNETSNGGNDAGDPRYLLRDFKVLGKLGRGGMGVVYLTKHLPSKQRFAVKMLAIHADQEANLERFQREVSAIAKLKHRGIPNIHHAWQEDGDCFIAMDVVDGVDLQGFISHLQQVRQRPHSFDRLITDCRLSRRITKRVLFDSAALTASDAGPIFDNEYRGSKQTTATSKFISERDYIRRVSQIFVEAALILEHAHKHGVVHRDVKPSNIMINEECVFLIDFGLSRMASDLTLTLARQAVGTPRYMSPEQIAFSLKVDKRTDVYSLGLAFYEVLTLTAPVQADTYEGLVRRVLAQPLIPVSWHNSTIPVELQSIVHKATAKNADDRYQHARDLAADLESWLHGRPVCAEAYYYQFADHEVIARRPMLASIAGGWLLYVAAFYGIILFPLQLGTELQGGFSATPAGLTVARYLLPAALATFSGWFFLRGRKWALWLAVATTLFVTADSTVYLVDLLKIVQAVGAFTMLFQFGHLLMGRLPIIAGGVFLLCVATRSQKIIRWLQYSFNAVDDFSRLRKEKADCNP